MTIATTETGTVLLTPGCAPDADVDLDAEFVDLIYADPDLVDAEFAAIVAELGQPGRPSGHAPVPVPRPDRRGVRAPCPATPSMGRDVKGALEGRSRQRSPPEPVLAPRVVGSPHEFSTMSTH